MGTAQSHFQPHVPNPSLVASEVLHGEVLTRTGLDLAAVTLHLYEVGAATSSLPLGLAWLVGWATYQCGIEVYGVEWTYDRRDGVSWCRPKSCQGRTLCQSVSVGTTLRSRHEALEHARDLRERWTAGTYNSELRHSGHFVAEFCQRLGIGPLAPWVQRLHSPVAMASAFSDGIDLGLPHRAFTAVRLCCVEGAQAGGASSVAFISAEDDCPDEALEKFAKWTTDHVHNLKCEVPVSDLLSTGRSSLRSTGNGSSLRSKSSGPSCERPAYRLVRERWLRHRRAKNRRSGAFLAQPPRCSPSCSVRDKDSPDAATEVSTSASPRSLTRTGSNSSLHTDSDLGLADERMALLVNKGGDVGITTTASSGNRSVCIATIDRTRDNLDEIQVGDVIMAVNHMPVMDLAEYEEKIAGLQDLIITVRRPEGDEQEQVFAGEDYQRLAHFWQGKTGDEPRQHANFRENAARGPLLPPVTDGGESPDTVGTPKSSPSMKPVGPISLWSAGSDGPSARELTPRESSSSEEVSEFKLTDVSRWIDGYVDDVETKQPVSARGNYGGNAVCRGRSTPATTGASAFSWLTVWQDGSSCKGQQKHGLLGFGAIRPAWIGRTEELLRTARDLDAEARAAPKRARKVAHL